MNKLSIGFLILFLCSTGWAADSLSVGLPLERNGIQKAGDDISFFGEDLAAYFTAPLHFSSRDWLIAGGIGIGTTVLMSFDSWGQAQAQAAPHTPAFQSFMSASRQYGEFLVAGGIIGTAYFGGLFFDHPWLRTTGRELIEALAYSGLTTTAFKIIIARARPYVDRGVHFFLPFNPANGHNSLPSGHTTVAFALSTVLAERIHNTWATIALYGAASCTAFSRMYHNQHWLSDVFLGAAIGTSAGIFVSNRNDEREHPLQKTTSSLLIFPSIGGVSALWKF